MSVSIKSPLTLASGLQIPNRLAKAAMTEGLADARNRVTDDLVRLYQRWADGGIGLMITGNVQIHRHHLERIGNVVIDETPDDAHMEMLGKWAAAGKSRGGAMIMQVSHAGRQTPKLVNAAPAAPSPVPLGLPGGQFGKPRTMTEEEIAGVVAGMGRAASVAKEAGFDGIQVHAAHGYLLSSFLSPLANQRGDDWGGPLENRARLLVDCVTQAKVKGGPGFSVSVKLNSADFQKGGFSHEDCLSVIEGLNELGLDFVEISGGNYEQPKMMDTEGLTPVFEEKVRESTRAREAYFANYARSVQERAKMPLMVTGGFRSVGGMNAALEDGEADIVGLARPLCVDVETPKKLLDGEIETADMWEKQLRIGPGILGPNSPLKIMKALNGFGAQGWYYEQLKHLGAGRAPDPDLGVFKAFRAYQSGEKKGAKAWRKAMNP